MKLEIGNWKFFLPLLLISSLVLLTVTRLTAGGDPSARLYVVNALSQDLSIIDTATDTVVGAIALGARGYRVAFSPDGQTAYVTTAPGTEDAEGQKALPATPHLLVVDLARGEVRGRLPLDIAPLANVHVAPDGQRAYVVTAAGPGKRNSERGQVLFVELPGGATAGTVPIGLNPLDSVLTPAGDRLFTVDWASRALSVIDVTERRLQDTIPLGGVPARALAVSPDGSTIYAAVERVPEPVVLNNGNPYNVMTQNAANNFNAESFGGNGGTPGLVLCAIDVKSHAVTRLPIDGLGPVSALAVSPNGARLYVYAKMMDVFFTSDNVNQPRNAPAQQATQQQHAQPVQQMQQAARIAEATYELLAVDLRKRVVEKRYGAFGYLATMMLTADGSKLYLIGTPGDPMLEAALRAKSRGNRNNEPVMSKGGAPSQAPTGQANDVQTLLADLRRLPKTVTVLDTATGKRLKTLTIGSLPQGAGMAK